MHKIKWTAYLLPYCPQSEILHRDGNNDDRLIFENLSLLFTSAFHYSNANEKFFQEPGCNNFVIFFFARAGLSRKLIVETDALSSFI